MKKGFYVSIIFFAATVLMLPAEGQRNNTSSKKDSRPNTIVIQTDDLDYSNMVVIAEKLQG